METLEALLDDEKYPNVRLGAARTVAEIGIRQHDAETILKKLDELETHQREQRSWEGSDVATVIERAAAG